MWLLGQVNEPWSFRPIEVALDVVFPLLFHESFFHVCTQVIHIFAKTLDMALEGTVDIDGTAEVTYIISLLHPKEWYEFVPVAPMHSESRNGSKLCIT